MKETGAGLVQESFDYIIDEIIDIATDTACERSVRAERIQDYLIGEGVAYLVKEE